MSLTAAAEQVLRELVQAWCGCAGHGSSRALKEAMALICAFQDYSLSSGPVIAPDMLFLCRQLCCLLKLGVP